MPNFWFVLLAHEYCLSMKMHMRSKMEVIMTRKEAKGCSVELIPITLVLGS